METLSGQKEEEKGHCLATTTYTTQPFSRVSPTGSILYFFFSPHFSIFKVFKTYSFTLHGKYHNQSNPGVMDIVHPPLTHLVEFSPSWPSVILCLVLSDFISDTLEEERFGTNWQNFQPQKNTANLFSSKVFISKKIYFSLHFMVIMMIYIFTLSVVGAS